MWGLHCENVWVEGPPNCIVRWCGLHYENVWVEGPPNCIVRWWGLRGLQIALLDGGVTHCDNVWEFCEHDGLIFLTCTLVQLSGACSWNNLPHLLSWHNLHHLHFGANSQVPAHGIISLTCTLVQPSGACSWHNLPHLHHGAQMQVVGGGWIVRWWGV